MPGWLTLHRLEIANGTVEISTQDAIYSSVIGIMLHRPVLDQLPSSTCQHVTDQLQLGRIDDEFTPVAELIQNRIGKDQIDLDLTQGCLSGHRLKRLFAFHRLKRGQVWIDRCFFSKRVEQVRAAARDAKEPVDIRRAA